MDTHVEANTNDQYAGNRKGIVALYSLTAYAPVDFGIVAGMHQFDMIAVLEEIDDPPPLINLKSFDCICCPILDAIDWIFPNRPLTQPITGCLVS